MKTEVSLADRQSHSPARQVPGSARSPLPSEARCDLSMLLSQGRHLTWSSTNASRNSPKKIRHERDHIAPWQPVDLEFYDVFIECWLREGS